MRILISALLLMTITGCYAHTPSSVRVDGVGEIRYDGHHHGSGKFCPPGQAKKHNC